MSDTDKLPEKNHLNVSAEVAAGSGAASIAAKSTWPVQDTMHILHSAEAVRTGATAHHAASIGGVLSSHAGGFLSVAAGTGISAYINHLVHGHQEKNLLQRYRPQIASFLGKEEETVTVDDLYSVAKQNPALDEELDRNSGMRNLRTAGALIGTTAAFTAVFLAATFFPPLAALGVAAASSGLFSMTGLGFVAACTAVSFGTLHVMGKGLTKLGHKLMGYDTPSVEDHVHGLDKLYKDGKDIAPEQVMGVFVASSPEMQASIKASFGKRYEKLTEEQQKQAEVMFGNHLPLEQIAANINAGELNPRELLFTVHGQSSGHHNAGVTREHAMNEKADAPKQEQPPAPQQPSQQQTTEASQWREMVEKQRAEQPSCQQSR